MSETMVANIGWRRRPADRLARLRALLVPHRIVMAVLFLGAISVGWLLLPGERERIAMLERDGQFRQALDILEARFEHGDRSQRVLYQLQRLYEHFGDLDKSRRSLELLAAQRPRDPHLRRRLARFYKQTQDEPSYIAALESELAIAYSEPTCRELIGLYRRSGEYEREQKTIGQCRERGYRRADDVVRLAHLVAADGDLAQAASLLRSVDDRRKLPNERDRLVFFAAMLEADQAEEAQKRGIRWLKAAKDDNLAMALIETLIRENRHELAMELTRQVSRPGDSISLAVAEIMLSKDEDTAARSYLRGWLEKAQSMSVSVVSRFIVAALEAVDPELAFAGAEKFGLKRLQQVDLASLAEALAAVGRTKEFEAVREFLAQRTVEENPLLGAAVEMASGTPEIARQQLQLVSIEELDDWRLALWARLMEQTGNTSSASIALRDQGGDGARAARPQTRWHAGAQGRDPARRL